MSPTTVSKHARGAIPRSLEVVAAESKGLCPARGTSASWAEALTLFGTLPPQEHPSMGEFLDRYLAEVNESIAARNMQEVSGGLKKPLEVVIAEEWTISTGS